MKYRSKDTVASILAIPQTKPQNLAAINCKDIALRARSYMNSTPTVSPDQQAVEFYALNQCVAAIAKVYGKDSVLPLDVREVVEAYADELVQQSSRLFFYMLMITTRESRHSGTGQKFTDKYRSEFGDEALNFLSAIHGSGSSGAVQYFKDNPPNMPLGKYSRALEYCFFNAQFGGGYGGKPWGNIAKTFADMVNGVTSLEIMVDTAYTLAHNNGPMFNKGMLYSMYSQNIIKTLDVQRSGQMVEHVLEGGLPSEYVSDRCRDLCYRMKKLLPDEFGDYVDWFKVENLGAVGDYESLKMKQTKKYGAPLPKEFTGMVASGKLEIFPNASVNLFKRKHAKAA